MHNLLYFICLHVFCLGILLEKGIKEIEKKRNEMSKKLYEAQDEMDDRKEGLIERVEIQLRQKTKLESLFILRWRVV